MGLELIDMGVMPVLCEAPGGPSLVDVDWMVVRRLGVTTNTKQITRQEAFDLSEDADTSFAVFDSSATTVLGSLYSNDPADARKALWRSFQLVCPESVG